MTHARLAARPTLPFDEGIGQATARRTYLRKLTAASAGEDARWESREDMAYRVAAGNVLLAASSNDRTFLRFLLGAIGEALKHQRRDLADRLVDAAASELPVLRDFFPFFDGLRTGGILTAGRHLQHGDLDLADRPLEISTNCSTSASSAVKLCLLLNGSGVGRLYDDDIMLVDWAKQPTLHLVLSPEHPDYDRVVDDRPWNPAFLAATPQVENGDACYHLVEDSREGWAKAVEIFENITFLRSICEETYNRLILDFSAVREKGVPIKGMQNRPSSGPVPLMHGLYQVSLLRDTPYEPWESNMVVDHELASVVAVGGVRRAARIGVKRWDDPGIFRFIEFKRDPARRTTYGDIYFWSSNNSVGVDREFWAAVEKTRSVLNQYQLDFAHFANHCRIGVAQVGHELFGACYRQITSKEHPEIASQFTERELLAANVFIAASACAYYDGTGEPGLLNLDLLADNRKGLDEFLEGVRSNTDAYIGYDKFSLSETSRSYYARLAEIARTKKHPFIVNPCSEIPLLFLGGYCVLGSLAPANLVRDYQTIGERRDYEVEEELTELARQQARFLMRVNLLPALYSGEVRRTNRIGVGLCAPHSFYMAQWGIGFRDVVSPSVYQYLMQGENAPLTSDERKACEFWQMMGRISAAMNQETVRYAQELGRSLGRTITPPHTSSMTAPNGTVAKLDCIEEGAHLPSRLSYLRNVQFDQFDALVDDYRAGGYPVYKMQRTFQGKTIVGFLTRPFITKLAVRLDLEDKLVTAAEATVEEQYRWIMLLEKFWIKGGDTHPGGQVSYTLKYRKSETSFGKFAAIMAGYQSQVRCTSVMPQEESETPDPYGLVEAVTGQKPGMSPFEYLPEQPIPLEVYEEIERRIAEASEGKRMEEEIGREHLDCATGACPIDFKDAE